MNSSVICSRLAILAAIALSCLDATADAAEKRPNVNCSNAISTVEINHCALGELEAADAKLNDVYKRALAALQEMAVKPPFDARRWEQALRKSQRAWLAYRDAECKDHVPMHWTGGTGTNADVLGCMTTLTEARTKALADRYDAP